MRRETEMLFGHIVRNGRNVLELIDSDYTFLNERLAKYYGISDVKGEEMRRVALPPGGPRGGVLTQGTVLAVTSNPDRTSPVKRGLFILDNILGTPPAPPPPDIPPLEDAARRSGNKKPTLREALALHRQDAKCSSCHNRMDPLGLALENFNALGRWRDKERGQPIDASGKLITGEEFTTIQELKHVLVNQRQRDFYRCLSEKLLTYALGRGLGYDDVEAVDQAGGASREQEWQRDRAADGRCRFGPVSESSETTHGGGERGRRDEPAEAGGSDREAVHEIDFGTERASLSRRHFLRGLGVCVALPAFESLGLARPLAAAAGAKNLATTATGAPLRTAFVYFPNGAIPKAWWPTGAGADFQLKDSLQPLEPYQELDPGSRRLESPDGERWTGRGRRPCTRQRHVFDGRALEEERDRHPGRSLDRPGDRAADRSAHAVPLARAGDRCDPQIGGLRLGLCVCLSVQPLLELADDAHDARNQSPAGIRAPFRQWSAGRAARQSGAQAPRAAVRPRFRRRRGPVDATSPAIRRQGQARPVLDRRPRARNPHRKGGTASVKPPTRRSIRPSASRRTTRNTSS